MKRISFLLLLFSIIMATVNFAMADDFYYGGSPAYNPYNGYTVMSLPPPPPMSSVPFYVRDDYDDYLEDYYKCILGYEYKGMTCRYWRKYAEKNGFYQKTAPAQNNANQSAAAQPQQQAHPQNQAPLNNQVKQQAAPAQQGTYPAPYTPNH